VRVRGAVDEQMIPLMVHAVDRGRIMSVGPADDHAQHLHDIVLQPGRVEARNDLRGGDQNLLPLVAAYFAARALVLDVDCADLALDEFFYQNADVMLAAVAGVAVGNDQRRSEVGRRGPFPLRRCHPDPFRSLNLVLVQPRAHLRRAFPGDSVQGIVGEVRAGVLGIGPLCEVAQPPR